MYLSLYYQQLWACPLYMIKCMSKHKESTRIAVLNSAVHRSRRAGAGAGVLTYFAGAGAGVCSPPVKL